METEFFKALDKTRAWKIKDGMLLLLRDSALLARFTRVQTLYNDDSRSVSPNPENYTVQFLGNGGVNLKADCKRLANSFLKDRYLHIDLKKDTGTMKFSRQKG